MADKLAVRDGCTSVLALLLQRPVRTQAALECVLLHDLAIIVHDYIMPHQPWDMGSIDIDNPGYIGHGELFALMFDIRILEGACYAGHIDLVKMALAKEPKLKTATDFPRCMEAACHGGHTDIVQLLADMTPISMYWACYGGNLEIVDLGIARGDTDWNYGLWGACNGRQHDMINYMIKCGATLCYGCSKSIKRHL